MPSRWPMDAALSLKWWANLNIIIIYFDFVIITLTNFLRNMFSNHQRELLMIIQNMINIDDPSSKGTTNATLYVCMYGWMDEWYIDTHMSLVILKGIYWIP